MGVVNIKVPLPPPAVNVTVDALPLMSEPTLDFGSFKWQTAPLSLTAVKVKGGFSVTTKLLVVVVLVPHPALVSVTL